ncbi:MULTISPECIES: DUF3180 domain-containing protein [unclassified Luteococcus]|uniref:DUF3180 domain-containing protein n=1 Tax=unclassified Luteococcus TaxID=2639923 RepID=UPI00313F18FA
MSQPDAPQLPGGRPGGLGLTTRRQAVISVMAGMVVGWFIVGTLQATGREVPITPWSLPLSLAALGAAAWVYARILRRQVAEQRGSLPHDSGVRALVLGKTMLMTGAVLAGGHLVYVLSYLGDWNIPNPRQRVIHGLLTILASAVFAVAGRDLERACVVPPGDDEPHDGEPSDEDQQEPRPV